MAIEGGFDCVCSMSKTAPASLAETVDRAQSPQPFPSEFGAFFSS